MQKRLYSRQERFHAQEKELLKPLPGDIYEMHHYADLKVQANCHVELRQNKMMRFYSVPYQYVGRWAHVIFTRPWVNIYVDRDPVASHMCVYEYALYREGAYGFQQRVHNGVVGGVLCRMS